MKVLRACLRVDIIGLVSVTVRLTGGLRLKFRYLPAGAKPGCRNRCFLSVERAAMSSNALSALSFNDKATRPLRWQASPIQPPRDEAKSVLPTSVRRRASDTEAPTNCFPRGAIRPRPDEFGILGFEPAQPFEPFLHPTDGCGRRRWQPHRFCLLADAVRELDDHRRPCVEIARHAHRRQAPHHLSGFGQASLDHFDGPVIHGLPPAVDASRRRVSRRADG